VCFFVLYGKIFRCNIIVVMI